MSDQEIRSVTQSLIPPSRFHLYYTLKCGQIFGWKNLNGGFAGLVKGRPAYLKQENGSLHFASAHEIKKNLSYFFRWDDNLEEMELLWEREKVLQEAFRTFKGLRLIRQDPWSCLVGFVLSMFSNIPKIETTLQRLAKHANREVLFLGIPLFSVPPAHEMQSMKEKTLRSFGMGFRAPYLKACAKAVANGFPLHQLKDLPYLEARRNLMELPGIGEKVADCILLFSLEHLEAFPVDIWMQRVLEHHYFSGKGKTPRYLSEWGRDKFGPFAGYAQQYLYAFSRESSRGRAQGS